MLEVLYEDNHIIAVNKRVSDIVQGDKTGDEPLSEKVKAYIKAKYNKPGDVYLGVPHRVDRPVSGVVVFARTSKALTRLNKMFQEKEREIKKIYWAITCEQPQEEEGDLIHYLVRDSEKNITKAYTRPQSHAKEAQLHYKLIGSSDRYYFLEVQLYTGRHHQIRCQLAKIGCSIRGDLKYGAPRSNPDGGINLHARSISFVHPVTKEMLTITAPVPKGDSLWKLLEDSQNSK
ncbi:MAG: RluA family pseudouridine synthase [Odoribacter sp.]|nr:RluA family pseudouridine synthase [Bacteroidales bacterium]MBR2981164.1 RluA family pseudouridine synthase [Odoribacter sp.]